MLDTFNLQSLGRDLRSRYIGIIYEYSVKSKAATVKIGKLHMTIISDTDRTGKDYIDIHIWKPGLNYKRIRSNEEAYIEIIALCDEYRFMTQKKKAEQINLLQQGE